MTPSGPYRTLLERHLRETRGHANRVRSRIRAIERRRPIATLVAGAGGLILGVVQAAVGQVLAAAKTPFDLVRGGLRGEEKLLKNAKDECAIEELEIVTYDAIEELAEQVGDDETARLAAAIRVDEERFLAQLRQQIPALTEAVVAAEFGHGTYRLARTGAVQAVRGVGRSAARRARLSGEALEEAGREAAQAGHEAVEAAEAAGEEAVAAAEAAGRKVQRGAERTAREVSRGTARTTRRVRQAAARTRSSVTAAERQPWPGYDEQRVEEIAERLEHVDARAAEQVREYESRHKDRTGVIEAAQKEARKEESQAKERQPESVPH